MTAPPKKSLIVQAHEFLLRIWAWLSIHVGNWIEAYFWLPLTLFGVLPMPVETFITVDLEEHGDQGHMLKQFYNAVLKKTLEEAKNDPKAGKAGKSA